MAVELNHTIVYARDTRVSASFLADVLGRSVEPPMGHFLPVRLDNGVTLDFMQSAEVRPQHYAFLVDDALFDAAYRRLLAAGVATWADPGHTRPGEINTRGGGRGVYFADPDGHNMEILTRALG